MPEIFKDHFCKYSVRNCQSVTVQLGTGKDYFVRVQLGTGNDYFVRVQLEAGQQNFL